MTPHVALPHIPLVISPTVGSTLSVASRPSAPGAARVVCHGVLLRLVTQNVGQEVLIEISIQPLTVGGPATAYLTLAVTKKEISNKQAWVN